MEVSAACSEAWACRKLTPLIRILTSETTARSEAIHPKSPAVVFLNEEELIMNIRKLSTCLVCVLFLFALSVTSFAQGRATLRGLITDEFGAAIVGATVTLKDAAGAPKTAT